MSFGHLTGLRFIELADPLMIIGVKLSLQTVQESQVQDWWLSRV